MGKTFRKAALTLGGVLLAGGALAQDQFISGVYLGTQELCQEAKSSSLDKVIQEGNLVLTAKGLRGTDYDCAFVQTLKAPNAKGWVVTSFCHESSGDFPDMLTVTQADDGTLSVVSVYGNGEADDSGDDSGGDNGNGGDDNAQPTPNTGGDANADSGGAASDTGTYVHCDGLTAP